MSAKSQSIEPATPATLNIYQRLLAASSRVEKLQKQESNNGLKYKFVSHDQYVGMCRPILNDVGIHITWTTSEPERGGAMTVHASFVNVDNPDEHVESQMTIPVPFNTPQGFGGALSYGKKFILSAQLLVETGDDDLDFNKNNPPPKPDRQKATPAKTPALTPASAEIKGECAELVKSLKLSKDERTAIWTGCGATWEAFRDRLVVMGGELASSEAEELENNGGDK